MNPLAGAALIAVLCLMAPTAHAGIIHGMLRVPSAMSVSTRPMNAYPGQAGSMAGMPATLRGVVTDAIVYVDHVPALAESALKESSAAKPRLAQKDQAFVPRVLAVAVGTQVGFPNQDPIYHNVFSLSPVRRFNLGKYPRGSSRDVLFNKPGLVNVYCDIHSDMEAFVLVLPHHGFVQPLLSGEYQLPDLPAGRYVLRVWHPDLGDLSTTVDVPTKGDVTANLSY